MTDNLSKYCFAPVVNERVCVLILGSLPGEASLAAARYYAHPRNQFWSLMSKVINVDLISLGYEQRLDSLLDRNVGLWDVVASARRQGSLDTALREVAFNDLQRLINGLPQLRVIAFNGKTAARAASQLNTWTGEIIVLPSSSPALTVPYKQKEKAWLLLRQFC